jgi:hypothetical protein
MGLVTSTMYRRLSLSMVGGRNADPDVLQGLPMKWKDRSTRMIVREIVDKLALAYWPGKRTGS